MCRHRHWGRHKLCRLRLLGRNHQQETHPNDSPRLETFDKLISQNRKALKVLWSVVLWSSPSCCLCAKKAGESGRSTLTRSGCVLDPTPPTSPITEIIFLIKNAPYLLPTALSFFSAVHIIRTFSVPNQKLRPLACTNPVRGCPR